MNKSSATAGLGIADVLTIVFIVLKLVGVIKWSWLWVLAPTWIMLLIALIIAVVVSLDLARSKRKARRKNNSEK